MISISNFDYDCMHLMHVCKIRVHIWYNFRSTSNFILLCLVCWFRNLVTVKSLLTLPNIRSSGNKHVCRQLTGNMVSTIYVDLCKASSSRIFMVTLKSKHVAVHIYIPIYVIGVNQRIAWLMREFLCPTGTFRRFNSIWTRSFCLFVRSMCQFTGMPAEQPHSCRQTLTLYLT